MSKKRYIQTIFIIIALCIAIYTPGLHGPLLLDSSKLYSLEKLFQTSNELTIQSISFGNLSGRVLAQLTFYFNIVASNGIDPFAIKLTNLIMHLINALLILVLTTLLLKKTTANNKPFIALLTFSFWTLSPTNMGSVLYSIQRMNQLSTFFTLICLIIFMWLRLKDNASIQDFIRAYSTIVISAILAFFSKENAILIPIFILLIEFSIIKDTPSKLTKNQFFLIIIGCIASVITLLITIESLNLLNYQSRYFSLYERLLTESRVLTIYLYELVLPQSIATGLYNDGFIISKSLFKPISTLFSSLIIFGLIVISMIGLYKKKHSLICFGILFFFCGHLLESTVFPLEIYYEHRNYLPSLGIYFALALFISKLIKNASKRLSYGLIGIYIGLFTFISFSKATTWSNELAAFTIAAHKGHVSPRAYANLAQIHLDNNQADKSIELLHKISNYHPHHALRSRLQTLFIKCQTNIAITKKEYEDLSSITLKELDIEISQALDNLTTLHHKLDCTNLDIMQLREALQKISSQYQKANKDSWHIDYYLIQLYINSGNLIQAVKILEKEFARDQIQAGYFLEHLVNQNKNLSVSPEIIEKLANLKN